MPIFSAALDVCLSYICLSFFLCRPVACLSFLLLTSLPCPRLGRLLCACLFRYCQQPSGSSGLRYKVLTLAPRCGMVPCVWFLVNVNVSASVVVRRRCFFGHENVSNDTCRRPRPLNWSSLGGKAWVCFSKCLLCHKCSLWHAAHLPTERCFIACLKPRKRATAI